MVSFQTTELGRMREAKRALKDVEMALPEGDTKMAVIVVEDVFQQLVRHQLAEDFVVHLEQLHAEYAQSAAPSLGILQWLGEQKHYGALIASDARSADLRREAWEAISSVNSLAGFADDVTALLNERHGITDESILVSPRDAANPATSGHFLVTFDHTES